MDRTEGNDIIGRTNASQLSSICEPKTHSSEVNEQERRLGQCIETPPPAHPQNPLCDIHINMLPPMYISLTLQI